MKTTHTIQTPAAPVKTEIPLPRRFLRCVACGTWKKERGYALCAECFRTNGTLSRGWFGCFARHAEREGLEYSFRDDPRFGRACRVYARRRQRREATAVIDALLPPVRHRDLKDPRSRWADEAYDGLEPYDLEDILDWQMHGVALPKPERSGHREMTDAEIARWDARVDAWAEAHGFSLAAEPAPEIGRGGTR